jgi:glycosyltransferase involved in cell wall biosynthesis
MALIVPRFPHIIFATSWKRLHDGWCVAARQYALAMHHAGVHVNLHETVDSESAPLDPEVAAEVKPITEVPFSPVLDYYLYSGLLGGYERMKRTLYSFHTQPVKVGFHSFFERTYLEPELVRELKRVPLLTTSRANERVLRAHGLTDVTRIPYPWTESDPLRSIPEATSSRNFYWIGRFEPRKAPDQLIRAFMTAFKPGEARLTLKLSMFDFPGIGNNPEAVILDQLREGNGWTVHNWSDHIILIRQKLSNAEMLRLHAENDVYVSSARGEGLELGAWAAKQAGRMLVVTESGGPEDIVGDSDILVRSTGTMPAHACYEGLWGKGARYYDYSFEDLVAGLQVARSFGMGSASRHWTSEESHRSTVVGRQLKEWLSERVSLVLRP